MRVLFYTYPFFLEPALHFAREMSPCCELHLMLERTPRSLGSLLATTPAGLPSGLADADRVLASAFPPGVRLYWLGARSFRLAVYENPRTVHPATIPTSLRCCRRSVPRDQHYLPQKTDQLGLAAARTAKAP